VLHWKTKLVPALVVAAMAVGSSVGGCILVNGTFGIFWT
jgi:hypothetical protein